MKSNLAKLACIRLLFWMHFFSAVLTAFFTQWGGLTLSQVFLLNAWFFLWNFILEAPTGALADAIGRKWALAAGGALGVGACLLYTSRPSLPVFLLAEAIYAGAYALSSGADDALAYETLRVLGREKESKTALARLESFKLGGIIVGALAGGFIAQRWGLTAPLRAYAIPASLACLLALTLEEPAAHEGRARPPVLTALREGGRYFMGHPILRALTLESALTNALAWSLIWLFQPLLMRAGLPVASFGVVQSLGCAGQIAVLSDPARWERLLGSKTRLLLVTGVGAGAAFLVLGVARSPALVCAGIVLAFSLGLSRLPVYSSYLNKHIEPRTRATVLSFSSMVRTFAIVLINPIVGRLSDVSLDAALLTAGAGLVCVPLFLRAKEEDLLD